ncbi:Crustacean calcium-binding protein 23 [Penaeus vannamei]|uniref:Crustacean calcium-binding protein 23 n=1 Tax=Penaeus vannamei TaxID=6689 RepID=A0A3R7PJS8_PENVA|nr:Crustacean calcium-binding protein 23 [Penaeus vannamei]
MPPLFSHRMTREDDLKEAAAAEVEEAGSAIERLRALCLTRGYTGIMIESAPSMATFRALADDDRRVDMFRRLDDDGSHALSKSELTDVLHQFGLAVSDDDVSEIFSGFDEDESGSINYNEFLDKLRPEMTEDRVAVVEEAFAKLDQSGDGVVTLDDVKDTYDASHHPRVLSGESTEEEILLKFIGRFEGTPRRTGS